MATYHPKKGDIVDVVWVDITEDSRGDPRKIMPYVLTHTWRFHSWRKVKVDGHTIECGAFTSSKIEKETDEYYHAAILPKAVILSIRKAT